MEIWLAEHTDLLLFGTFFLCFGFLLLRQYLINRAPEYSATVVVDSHQTHPARYHGRWSSGWNHLVTFRLADGDLLTLYTSEQDFMALKDGQTVTILWQNENLLQYE